MSEARGSIFENLLTEAVSLRLVKKGFHAAFYPQTAAG